MLANNMRASQTRWGRDGPKIALAYKATSRFAVLWSYVVKAGPQDASVSRVRSRQNGVCGRVGGGGGAGSPRLRATERRPHDDEASTHAVDATRRGSSI